MILLAVDRHMNHKRQNQHRCYSMVTKNMIEDLMPYLDAPLTMIYPIAILVLYLIWLSVVCNMYFSNCRVQTTGICWTLDQFEDWRNDSGDWLMHQLRNCGLSHTSSQNTVVHEAWSSILSQSLISHCHIKSLVFLNGWAVYRMALVSKSQGEGSWNLSWYGLDWTDRGRRTIPWVPVPRPIYCQTGQCEIIWVGLPR